MSLQVKRVLVDSKYVYPNDFWMRTWQYEVLAARQLSYNDANVFRFSIDTSVRVDSGVVSKRVFCMRWCEVHPLA